MKDYKKYFIISAQPDEIYAALTHEPTVELWTGAKASIKAEPGAEFSMWDDSIVGKFIELIPGSKIVQQWYFGEEETESPSIVTIKLHAHKNGTSLEIRHTNIPDDDFDNITDGWENLYMAELIDFYDEDQID